MQEGTEANTKDASGKTGAQRSHGNPTTATPAGVCTWATVLGRQHPRTQQTKGIHYHLMLQITSCTDNGSAANGKVKPAGIF